MAVITFANTKGGAGKTTAALLLVTELLHRKYRVCVIDADPQRWFSRWYQGARLLPNFTIETYVSAPTIQKTIHERRSQFDFVIVDLPGIQSPLLAATVGLSDHVLVPIQGSSMDAQGGAQVLDLLRYLDRKAGLSIPHSVVLSRVNPMITTRSMQAVKRLLCEQQIHVLDTPIAERAAFREMFDLSRPLRDLPEAQGRNIDKAVANASDYTNDVLALVAAGASARSAPLAERNLNRLESAA
ncbi:ParA family protein [Rhizobium sp. AG855]|uniref:ParA family protein n=1 Tax=Rhizobium sp. AG855 TaxID=2183898 RepID=UPI000E73D88F|nr:ParA family protein [Rhizobium sp. AG855]RKE83478.1 chromosome partitioning protein [Rhizobium sp. AG855]